MRSLSTILGAVLLLATLATSTAAGAATLASGSRQGAVAVAVVPTGRLGDPANRFFQTFTSTGEGWHLTTPRGTATNGGIVVASPERGAAAVLPFFASHVTALGIMTAGRPARDGKVIPALAVNPTSLTVNPATGRMVLVTSRGDVLAAAAVGGRLRRVATTRAVAASGAGRRCGLSGIVAAATTPDGSLVVGGRCTRGGAGIFINRGSGGWSAVSGPGSGSWSVVRLDPTEDGVTALLASSGNHRALRTVHLIGSVSSWSPQLPVVGQLRSTAVSVATGAAATYLVALANRGSVQLWTLGLDGPPRRVGPALGSRVQAIVEGPHGIPAAFSVDGRTVVPMALDASSGRWVAQQRFVLPLAYGTSE